jgi:hypothetical protein
MNSVSMFSPMPPWMSVKMPSPTARMRSSGTIAARSGPCAAAPDRRSADAVCRNRGSHRPFPYTVQPMRLRTIPGSHHGRRRCRDSRIARGRPFVFASRNCGRITEGSACGSNGPVQTMPSASWSATLSISDAGSSSIAGGSKNGASWGSPTCQTFVPTTPSNIARRAASPEVAMTSQQSSGTPRRCNCCLATLDRGRGAFVTSTTVPPPGLERPERFHRLGKGVHTVMNAAPEIAETARRSGR